MSSPFPHPWDESSDLLLSSSNAQDLKYHQKKVQRFPFHQGICYARQTDFQAPWHFCFQHGCKKRMIKRPSFASFEPSGRLKQFGTFQPSLPTVLQWLHTHRELTVSSADSWGNSCCLLQGAAPVPVFGSAGRSFQRTLQRRDHKRLLPPSPEPAGAPGQQLSPERVPGAPASPLSILPSILSPAGPSAPPAAAAAALSEPASPTLHAVPPFSSSSPPSQRSHPPGGRQQLRNSPVEITDSSIFTR